jgi:phosphate/sulfate permease
MENPYLYILILLCILAIGDLIVGVSNDAVNFLNSAIGSKVISFRNIMILSSLGIAFGAISSNGMMDILLLDFFNTLGLPTSTTVSIVFELLGAAVIMATIKILEKGDSLIELSNYINTDKATQIIFGILLSILIAFTVGAISQWISRILLSFDFEKKSIEINSLFGGVALSSIFYFILIKGLKSTPYTAQEFDLLNGLTINQFVDSNLILTLIINFFIWFLLSLGVIKFLKVDVYKLIIGVGTFALALAFAGNDLVNFIGVPMAAYQSYIAWEASGIAASEFSMGILSREVQTPLHFLLLSGLIMILTLWFSSKARKVVKTSIDLSSQYDTRERFEPNGLSRSLVRLFMTGNSLFVKLVGPNNISTLNSSFVQKQTKRNTQDAPAFDKLRASVNLIIAAVLISLATSLKIPLSTTYVAFMVAMGTSLADRAWGADSAVFRVAGVLNVIGGWFITAISAFLVGGAIVYLLHIGGNQVIAIILFIVLLIIGKNYINHTKESKNDREEIRALIVESNSYLGVIEQTGDTIEIVMKKSFNIYNKLVEGLSKNEIKKLNKAKKEAKKLSNEIDNLNNGLFYFIRNLEESSISASNFYIELLGYLHDLSEDLSYLAKISYNHVNNNHPKLMFSQIKELQQIEENITLIFKESREAFKMRQDLKEFQDVLLEKNNTFKLINEKINFQIERTRGEETSPKNTTLYFNFLIRTKDLVTHKFELVEKYFNVVKSL